MYTQHPTGAKTITELARRAGSQANTREGARSYLIGRLRSNYKDIPIYMRGHRSPDVHQTREWHLRRLERTVVGRARAMGYPDVSPQWLECEAAYSEHAERERYRTIYQMRAIPVSEALCRRYTAAWDEQHVIARISGTVVAEITWDEEADWGYYSRRYGRPKNTYSNRRVDFLAIRDGKITTIYSHAVESFRGQFLRAALLAYSAATGDTSAADAVARYDKGVEESAPRTWTAYKIVRAVGESTYTSVYNPAYKYIIGETIEETARPNHGAGLYVWRTIEEARAALGNRNISCDGDGIIECEVGGRRITYDSGKIAVSRLTPVRWVEGKLPYIA